MRYVGGTLLDAISDKNCGRIKTEHRLGHMNRTHFIYMHVQLAAATAFTNLSRIKLELSCDTSHILVTERPRTYAVYTPPNNYPRV